MACGGRLGKQKIDPKTGKPMRNPKTGKIMYDPPEVGEGITGLGGQISLLTAVYNITPKGSAQKYLHQLQTYYGERTDVTYPQPTRQQAIAHYEAIISRIEQVRNNPPAGSGIDPNDPKAMKRWSDRMDTASGAAKREVMWLKNPENRVPTGPEFAILEKMPKILRKFYIACRCANCGKFVAPDIPEAKERPSGQPPAIPPQPQTCPNCANAKPKVTEKRAARTPVEDLSTLMRNKEPRAVLSEPTVSSVPASAAAGAPTLLTPPPPRAPLAPAPSAPVAPLAPAVPPTRRLFAADAMGETSTHDTENYTWEPAQSQPVPPPLPPAQPVSAVTFPVTSGPSSALPTAGGAAGMQGSTPEERSAFQKAAEAAIGVYNCPKCGRWASSAAPCLCPPKVEDLSSVPEVALLREELAKMETEALPEVQALRDEINSGVFDDDPVMKQEAIMAEEEIEEHVRQLREEIEEMEKSNKPPFGPETDELGNPIQPPPAPQVSSDGPSPSAREAGVVGRVASRFLLNPKGWRMMAPYAFRAALVVGPVLLFAGTGLGPIAWIAAAFFAYRGQNWLRFNSGENAAEIMEHYSKPYWFQQGRAKSFFDRVGSFFSGSGKVIETPNPVDRPVSDNSQERDYDQELRDAGYGEALNNPGGATVR